MTEAEMKGGKGHVAILRKELVTGDDGRKVEGQVVFLRKEWKEERGRVTVLRKELGPDSDSVWLCDKNIQLNKT